MTFVIKTRPIVKDAYRKVLFVSSEAYSGIDTMTRIDWLQAVINLRKQLEKWRDGFNIEHFMVSDSDGNETKLPLEEVCKILDAATNNDTMLEEKYVISVDDDDDYTLISITNNSYSAYFERSGHNDNDKRMRAELWNSFL